jgi:ketosteroid isomerase-like protein
LNLGLISSGLGVLPNYREKTKKTRRCDSEMVEVRKEIEKGNGKFGEFVRRSDAKALSGLYTNDACLMPAGMSFIKGRKAIEAFWGGAIKGMGLKDAILKTVEVVGVGDTVTEMGEYLLKLQAEGKNIEDKGKYVVVWKNTPEGWRLYWDIWTSSIPPK